MADPAASVTVCVCAHRPRKHHLERLLSALGNQTLDRRRWEVLIVDNATDPPLETWVTPAALPAARMTREDELGLTRARLRAIREARGEILVFFDDDNVPDADYLEQILTILQSDRKLGVIGGRCAGEYEVEPPSYLRHFLTYLAVGGHGEAPIQGGRPGVYEAWHPRGAGLAIRRAAAEVYARQVGANPFRLQLDRAGSGLGSAGDLDMVLTAIEAGWQAGYFPQLRLRHLIPRDRLTFGYMRRMIYEANRSSYRLLMARRPGFRPWRWPLEYARALALCWKHGQWRPLTWLLALQIGRGRYAALRDSWGRN